MNGSLAVWTDINGDFILIGDEDCKPGDPLISVALTQDNILEWIKALITMLEDGEINALPGEIVKCTDKV